MDPNTEIVKGDFFAKGPLEALLEDSDYVVHCLSISTPAMSAPSSAPDTKMALRNAEIFKACAISSVKKIGFVSSADVYGTVSEKKEAEEDDKPEPKSSYGIAKLSSEQSLEYFRDKFGQRYVAYRLTNPYGPRQVFKKGQGVIPAFIDSIRAQNKVTIFGDGKNSRDFIYVEDAAKMMVDALVKPNQYDLYNIGSGEQISIIRIIQALQKYFDKKIQIEYKTRPSSSPEHISVSIERFRSEFGLPKFTTLEAGIARTIDAVGPTPQV